jgi:hypothetical protein
MKLRRERVDKGITCDEYNVYYVEHASGYSQIKVGATWKPRRAPTYSAVCLYGPGAGPMKDNYPNRDAAERALKRRLEVVAVIDSAYDPRTRKGLFLDGSGNALPDGEPPVYRAFRKGQVCKNSRGEIYQPQPVFPEVEL